MGKFERFVALMKARARAEHGRRAVSDEYVRCEPIFPLADSETSISTCGDRPQPARRIKQSKTNETILPSENAMRSDFR
jgi:hypothetical protein